MWGSEDRSGGNGSRGVKPEARTAMASGPPHSGLAALTTDDNCRRESTSPALCRREFKTDTGEPPRGDAAGLVIQRDTRRNINRHREQKPSLNHSTSIGHCCNSPTLPFLPRRRSPDKIRRGRRCYLTGILSLGDTLALEIAAAEADRPPQ